MVDSESHSVLDRDHLSAEISVRSWILDRLLG